MTDSPLGRLKNNFCLKDTKMFNLKHESKQQLWQPDQMRSLGVQDSIWLKTATT